MRNLFLEILELDIVTIVVMIMIDYKKYSYEFYAGGVFLFAILFLFRGKSMNENLA